jgi:hypothetical protein
MLSSITVLNENELYQICGRNDQQNTETTHNNPAPIIEQTLGIMIGVTMVIMVVAASLWKGCNHINNSNL